VAPPRQRTAAASANIFYENGYVKIGDYGLSKAMEPTQHSGQTITVGTVHYMAPEIGGGRYDKSIDIYAIGAVLYEMLTGQPPFLGSSAGEILMKHVSSEPDLTHVEEPFKTVVRRGQATIMEQALTDFRINVPLAAALFARPPQ
jgi:serine/threonine protein kinase